MSILTPRGSLGSLAMVLVIAATLAGCGNTGTGEAQPMPAPSLVLSPSDQPTGPSSAQPEVQPTQTPEIFVFGPLIDPGLDLQAGPVDVPLELQIPALNVDAPVLGVGLTPDHLMDAPKGPIGDPEWAAAFWFRGGGIPGSVGTATIAGHVNDPLGRDEIFAHLQNLHPGDLIIIHLKNTTIGVRFIVDQTRVYTTQQSSDPAVLTQIFGAGPVAGVGPLPSEDGLSHLTLITCAGEIINGQFDHHTVVFATRDP